MQSGLYAPDSAALLVPLGEVLVRLQPGDSVTLAATVSPDLAKSLPPDEQLVASSGQDTVRVPLRGGSVGATIYRAVAADSVRIHVGLTRRLSASPRSGAFTVIVNYGSAPLLSAWTPWIAPSAAGTAATAGLAAATTCTATAPGPSSCPDISVSIVPYAPGDPFGDFQSDPGTGVSNPVTITFSAPVASVTITIEDPTYAGNAMTAYRADGSIAGSVSFTGSGIPGIDIPDTQTITAAGIVRIVLTPAPLDYVAYSALTFVPEALASLTLSCPASVERGQLGTCSARTEPSTASLEVLGWVFRADIGGDVVERADAPQTAEWSGPMVASGTVQVQAKVNGVQEGATAHVGIAPRDWSALTVSLDLSEDSPGRLPPQPPSVHELGSTDLSAPVDLGAVATVDGGPNQGYAYFVRIPVRALAVVSINTAAMSLGSQFYLLQEEHRRRIGDSTYCPRSDVLTVFLPGVRRHEGTGGRSDANSHVAIYVAALERAARSTFESMVSREGFPGIGSVLKAVHSVAAADSKAMDSDGRNPFVAACVLHYF